MAGVLTGRTLVGAVRFRPLRRFTPFNAAASVLLSLVNVLVKEVRLQVR